MKTTCCLQVKINSNPTITTDTITTAEEADLDSAKSEDGLNWEERHM